MFALLCIEHIIVNGWNRMPPPEKQFLKDQALQILAAVHKLRAASGVGTAPPLFLQEKVVKLVAEIAKRDWPQEWKDMLEKLVKLTALNELTLQLVILVFR